MKKTVISSGARLAITIILLLTVSPAFSQTISDLQKNVDSFSTDLAQALPFNSSIGLSWSDAYIGQLMGLPPHFGIGVTAGATTIPTSALEGLTNSLRMSVPLDLIPVGFPLPGYVVDARIGGLIIPFDVGVKFGYIPQDLLSGVLNNVGLKYQLFGADIRYSLIDAKVIPFKLSAGLGFNRLEGGISSALSREMSFSFGQDKLTATAPDVGLIWETNVLELKTQVAFPFFVITPYAGFGASYAWSKAGYQVKSNIKINGSDINEQQKKDLKDLGITGIDNAGFSSISEVNDWNMRLFGGLSLNFVVIKLDFTAMFNIRDQSLGATVGLRFQL